MIRKFALSECTPVQIDTDISNVGTIIRTASGRVVVEAGTDKARILEAEIKKHPNALFFRAKAIKADEMNSNGDFFPESELLKYYKTFEGVPFFTNHDNQNVENARGKVIFAEWVPEEKAVYTICFVDRAAYPHLARSIEEEYTHGVSMGALHGDAEILMADMSVKLIQNVSIGDKVISHNGNINEVKNIHSEFLGQDMYSFDLVTYHKSPYFTYDHPIYVIDNKEILKNKKIALSAARNNFEHRKIGKTNVMVGQDAWRKESYSPLWKVASVIEKGDYFMVPSKYKLEIGGSENSDFYYLIGAFLGDGYLKKSKNGDFEGVSFCIGLGETKLAEKIIDLIKKYSSYKACEIVSEERNGLYITVYDRVMAKWFFENIGTGSKNKKLKTAINKLGDAKNLICGYIDTDGCIVDKTNQDLRGSKFGGVQISSANLPLLEDVQNLLIACGSISRISGFERIPNDNSVVNVTTFENTLSIGSNATEIFENSIKFSSSNFQKAQIKAGKSFITNVNGLNYMACPVKSINANKWNEPVYDLTVENDESYIADGVAVHNCAVEYSVCNLCENKAEKTEDYCFVDKTPILMSDLSVKDISDVVIGDKVIDAFGNITSVTHTFKHSVKDNLQVIKSRNICNELISTSNHPFLVERRGKYTYCEASLLLDKEILFTPIPKITKSEKLFTELAICGFIDTEENRLLLSKLIGYYVAEGSLIHDKSNSDVGFEISLHSDEKAYINEIINICKILFDKEPEIVDRNNYNHKCINVRIYHPLAVTIVKLSCNGLSRTKTLTENVISLPEQYLKPILAGYIDGDGHSDKYGRIVITTASRNLAFQMVHLFSLINVTATIGRYEQNSGPTNRDTMVDIYRVNVAMMQTSKLFDCGIKCNKSSLMAQLKSGCQTKLQNAFSNDGFIKHSAYSIEELPYDGDVFNLETESNSYVANNTSVHNCIHVKNRKGRKFTGRVRNVVTGEVKEFNNEPCYERNYGIKFIELSAVVDPACPSCNIQGIIKQDDYLMKAASMENNFRMLRVAKLDKQASKEEIDQIDQTLTVLEGIAVNLIKNRKQVEVSFASDLVDILSQLQEWFDELVGAGYGNIQSSSIPGVSGDTPAGGTPDLGALTSPDLGNSAVPAAGAPPTAPTSAAPTPAGMEMPASLPQTAPPPQAKSSKFPIITPPIRPKKASAGNGIQILAHASEFLKNINENINENGENEMIKRRTFAEKQAQKDKAVKVLSQSWKEKQDFYKYIKEVPSINSGNFKLAVKKTDDTFVVIAENLETKKAKIWTYEDLSVSEKEDIMRNPTVASVKLLDSFKNQKIEGVNRMLENKKTAGANSVNANPEVITEKQLDQKGIYHVRKNGDVEEITQKQLDALRENNEPDVLTQKQLDSARLNEEKEVVLESQLKDCRNDEDIETVMQNQLNNKRTNNEADVLTEKQLNNVDKPWARAAKRNSSQFKSAGEHMNAVICAMSETSIETGATPMELKKLSKEMVDGTQARYDLFNSIMASEATKVSKKESFASKAAYWKSKNVKFASSSTEEVAKIIISKLQVLASDETINPNIIVEAIDVIGDDVVAVDSINAQIDILMADAETKAVTSSIKDDLRKSLRGESSSDAKKERDEKRANILASVSNSETRNSERKQWDKMLKKQAMSSDKIGNADFLLYTSFSEVGIEKTGNEKNSLDFKRDVYNFTKGALSSNNLKMASITNVTISGDTIQIAVQTDGGEESIEIPIGGSSNQDNTPTTEETVPEGDMSGEGIGDVGGISSATPSTSAPAAGAPPAPMGAPSKSPAMASGKKTVKVAQTPSGAGQGVTDPNAGAPAAGAPPVNQDPIQSLMSGKAEDAGAEGEEKVDGEIPTVGDKQMPWTICPECGSSDVDVTNEEGDIHGKCNGCGAAYDALIKKIVEFTIKKPTKSMGEAGEEQPETPEAPEAPALPVAASTRIDKDSIVRIGNNKKLNGYVCPACGTKNCKASVDKDTHVECSCGNCQTQFEKDIVVSSANPADSFLVVKWDYTPSIDCPECVEKAKKFASSVKVSNMIRTAKENESKFPMSNCVERMAREYGSDTVASFGPCKGSLVADCVCKQLKKLALTKVRHMTKLAEASMQVDPMDRCVEDQKKQGYAIREAKSICKCLKNVNASKDDDNIFVQAFAEDIENGTEKVLTMEDLEALNEAVTTIKDIVDGEPSAPVEDVDAEIGDELPELKEIEVSVDNCTNCGQSICECEPYPEKKGNNMEKDIMSSSKIRRSESAIRLAEKPKQVETIEGNVEAGVPRKNQTLGNEGKDNIDVTLNKPNVPRGNAAMGHESEAGLTEENKLPDVAKDHSYMGQEQEIQKGMPAINNEIKGTVIAKKLTEVDSIEKDVEAGIPRGDATLGNEGKDNINVTLNKPSVPRAKADMGHEKETGITDANQAPDIPMGDAYMGDEKAVQKGMPANNDEMLKNVPTTARRNQQMDRIALARREVARDTASWLTASGRIPTDKGTFDSVVTALSSFEIDKISAVADQMFPERAKKTASKVENSGGLEKPFVVPVKENSNEDTLTTRIANQFTLGKLYSDK